MNRKMNVLLVEDNNLDAMMVERAMRKVAPDAFIKRATDGLEALEIINRDQMPKPYFILLDINMPRMNGHEFLSILRSSDKEQDCMVFMFTTSDSDQDIIKAYRGHVTGYIVKPQGTAGIKQVITTLQCYWNTCEPPLTSACA